MSDLIIGKQIINSKNKPFIIAEISGNHKKSLKRALRLVDLAASSGANAIKLQTFDPNKVTLKIRSKEFQISDGSSKWNKKYLYDLFLEAYTPWEWHKEIFQKAKDKKLEFFSTPFHEEAVDFLEKLNVPCYKISSFENNHIPLIEYISKTKKPIIISTGLAKKSEIFECVNAIKKHNNKQFALLKCVSSYPASPNSFNLKTILDMQKTFDCHIGLSDHTITSSTACVAVAMGSRIIEKHITLSSDDGAIDSFFSADKNNFKSYIQDINNSYSSLGKIFYGPTKEELSYLQERRSIYVVKNIKKNEKFTRENIAIIRPSYGIKPRFLKKIIGKRSQKNLKIGQKLKNSYIYK